MDMSSKSEYMSVSPAVARRAEEVGDDAGDGDDDDEDDDDWSPKHDNTLATNCAAISLVKALCTPDISALSTNTSTHLSRQFEGFVAGWATSENTAERTYLLAEEIICVVNVIVTVVVVVVESVSEWVSEWWRKRKRKREEMLSRG